MNHYASIHKAQQESVKSSLFHQWKPSYWITLETLTNNQKMTDKGRADITANVRKFVHRLCNKSHQHLMAQVWMDEQPVGGKYHSHLVLTTEQQGIPEDAIRDEWIGIVGKRRVQKMLNIDAIIRGGNALEQVKSIKNIVCYVIAHDEEHIKNAIYYSLKKHEDWFAIYACPKKGRCRRKPCNLGNDKCWNTFLNGEKLHLRK